MADKPKLSTLERHALLDELVAAYLAAHPAALPSTITVLELIQWSHAQTLAAPKPTFPCRGCA